MLLFPLAVSLVCAAMVFGFHMSGALNDSFLSALDSSDYFDEHHRDHSFVIIFSFACTIAAFIMQHLLFSPQFIFYLPLPVFAFVLYKSHRNPESLVFCHTADYFKCYVYLCFLFLLYTFVNDTQLSAPFFLICLPFLLLFSCALIARHNLMENLFHHYRSRVIKLESQVEKLKSDLEYYQARCRRLEKSDN